MTEPSPSTADAALVRRATRGDLEAFEALISRYQQGIYNIAYYKSQNCFDAEDLSQDIFLAAFKALPTLKDPENFSGWLFGIAYNRCHKWYQRERTKILKFQEIYRRTEQAERMGRLQSGQHGAAADGEEPAVSDVLSRLPLDVCQALKLKYLEGMSYQEIGERMGIKPHRIDYLIRKGKRMIRERWSARRDGDAPRLAGGERSGT